MADADADGFYDGMIFVDKCITKYPFDKVITWDGLKLHMSTKWTSRWLKQKLKLKGSDGGPLADTVNLRGVSGVVFTILIKRTAFRVPSALLEEEAENDAEVEIPFLPLNMVSVSSSAPKDKDVDTIKQLTSFIRKSFTESKSKYPWILLEDGTKLPGTAELPGLVTVTISTAVQTQDLVAIPPNLESQAVNYWIKYNGWRKGKVWTGYASERLIEAVLFNAYKEGDMFKVIFGKGRYGTLFKSRGSAKLLTARWNQMQSKLQSAQVADTKEDSKGKAVNWYFKELFEVLRTVIPKFEKKVDDGEYIRDIGHWAYFLVNDVDFSKLYDNPLLLESTNSLAFHGILMDLAVHAISPAEYQLYIGNGNGNGNE